MSARLTLSQREALRIMARRDERGWLTYGGRVNDPESGTATAGSANALVLRGLASRNVHGYRLTDEGREAAAALAGDAG